MSSAYGNAFADSMVVESKTRRRMHYRPKLLICNDMSCQYFAGSAVLLVGHAEQYSQRGVFLKSF